jgi:hypothetical protein
MGVSWGSKICSARREDTGLTVTDDTLDQGSQGGLARVEAISAVEAFCRMLESLSPSSKFS